MSTEPATADTPALAEESPAPENAPAQVPAVVGWSMISAGILMEIIPILPGFILFLLGASMLATRVPWCGRVNNWVARRYPETFARSQAMNNRFVADFTRRFPEP